MSLQEENGRSNDRKYGKCPWCGEENILTFVFGSTEEGKLHCYWICAKCLMLAREREMNKDGR